MNIQTAIGQLVDRQNLTAKQIAEVMRQILSGQASEPQIAGFLVALRMKGETLDEILGTVSVMRELVTPVTVRGDHLVDIVGTGGDGANLFNVSSASAFVAAAAGAKVAKHGNHSVSSSSGSADLLQAAGINIQLTPEQVARCIEEVGVGFMYAPAHHGAMRYAAAPRKALGIRTLFNMVGPMTNPAGVVNQVIGVFDKKLCLPVTQVLQQLGSEHVLVVHSNDGLDEISLAQPTHVVELYQGKIKEYEIAPEDFGITSHSLSGLCVDSSSQSLALIYSALEQEESEVAQKAADLIALNAGAAIYAAGVASDLAQGVVMAQDAIGGGLAREKIRELVSFSDCFESGQES